MGKVYEMSFKIAGEVNGTFITAFSRSSSALKKLRDESKQSKTELARLKKSFKEGSIGADEFAEAEKRLLKAIEKADDKIKRHAANARALKTAYQGVSTVAKTGWNIAGDAARVGAYAATGAAAYTVGSSASKAMDYEAQLSSIKAIGNLQDSEMQKVDKLALEVGAATKYSSLEAAKGMEELIKAGVSVPKIMDGALLDALNLATAGELELADAAAIMSTSLNAFKSDGVTSEQAANFLAGTASSAATSVSELQHGLAQVSAVASTVGLSLKDTTVAMGLFANNGLKGSDAGTSLKTMLMRLTPETKPAVEQFQKLGLLTKNGTSAFYDMHGNLKSLSEIAGLLQTSMKDLNNEQRIQALTTMFGSDAVRGASILFKEGAKGADEFAKSMSSIKVADVATEKMNNAKGAIERLSGAWETAQITVGKSFLPSVEKGADALGKILEGNQTKIAEASKDIEKSLLRIIEPLTLSVKPEYDAERAKMDSEYKKQYEQDLAKYMKFNNMDFADKFIYAFDTAIDELDEYIGADGGEKINKIFTHVAEIGMKSFASTLGSLLKSSVSEVFEGNFMAAAGLAIGANMMTRGLLGKAAGGLLKKGGQKVTGKWNDYVNKKNKDIADSKKPDDTNKKGTKATIDASIPDIQNSKNGNTKDVESKNTKKTTAEKTDIGHDKSTAKQVEIPTKAENIKTKLPSAPDKKDFPVEEVKLPDTKATKKTIIEKSTIEREKVIKQPKQVALKRTESPATIKAENLKTKLDAAKTVPTQKTPQLKQNKLGGIGKIAGKAAVPLALVGSVATVATAKDKVGAGAKEVGSLAGMAGGAKLGAALGTFAAPGIGTAIGGIAGSAIGGLLGSSIAQGLYEKLKQIPNGTANNNPQSIKAQADSLQESKQTSDQKALKKTTADSNAKLKLNTEEAGEQFKSLQKNIETLSEKISTGINSLNNIGDIGLATQNAIQALNDYAARINSAQVQGATMSVVKKTSSLLPEGRTKF